MPDVNRLQCIDRKRQGDYEWFSPKELTVIRNRQVIVMDTDLPSLTHFA